MQRIDDNQSTLTINYWSRLNSKYQRNEILKNLFIKKKIIKIFTKTTEKISQLFLFPCNRCVHNERIESHAFEQFVFGEHIPRLSRYPCLLFDITALNGGQTANRRDTYTYIYIYMLERSSRIWESTLSEKYNDQSSWSEPR